MQKISPHNLPPDFQLKKVLETEIGVVYFYDNIVIFEAKEGIVMSYKTGFSLLLKGLNYLGPNAGYYISNRINSYSIKPMDYKYLNNVPTLRALAVVNYNEIGHSECRIWRQNSVKNHSKYLIILLKPSFGQKVIYEINLK